MYLVFVIAILCLLIPFVSDIVRLLHIKDLIRKRIGISSKKLDQELDYQKKLDDAVERRRVTTPINMFTAPTNFEQLLQEELNKIRVEKRLAELKISSAEVIVTYCLKGLISFALFVISVRHRYTPVMIFDESLNFQPLTGIFSFPTGVPNALSVPMWVMSCNVTFNYIIKMIRSKV